jgi:putative peptidoglycan lipid II flippase
MDISKPLDQPNPQADHRGDRQQLMKGAAVTSFGTLLSRILGLLRDIFIARYFSAEVRDAFIVAFRLPNFFRRIFGEGSLAVSFLPALVHAEHEDPEHARKLARGVFTLLLGVTCTLSLVCVLCMDQIMGFLVSGSEYTRIPGKLELTIHLARIMFSFVVFVSLYAYGAAILQSFRRFAWPAFAPCFFNFALITGAWLSHRFGVNENWLAGSVLVGGFLQMLVLLPSLIRLRFAPRLQLKLQNTGTFEVARAFLPAVLGVGLLQLIALVNVYFASFLPQGSHAYLYLADRLLELPISLFVVSVSAALLPALSRGFAKGDRAGLARTVRHALHLTLFLVLPAALGLLILARPITEILFLGQEFKMDDVTVTSQIIQIYSAVLLLAVGVRLLSQGIFAIRNTWFPAVAALVSLLSHIAFAFALSQVFGVRGLAAANALSALVNLIMLVLAYNAWVGPLGLKEIAQHIAKCSLGLAVLAAVCLSYEPILRSLGGRYFPKRVVLTTIIIAAASGYFICAHFMKIPESRDVWQLCKNKFQSLKRARQA